MLISTSRTRESSAAMRLASGWAVAVRNRRQASLPGSRFGSIRFGGMPQAAKVSVEAHWQIAKISGGGEKPKRDWTPCLLSDWPMPKSEAVVAMNSRP